jgi:O-antigen ligase
MIVALMAGVASLGVVAFAIRTGRDIEIAALAVAGFGVLLSFRWPLLPLFAIAILIPFEEAIVIEGLGTLSRYAALAFILTYGLPRLGRLSIGAMPLAGFGYFAWAFASITWALDSSAWWGQVPALILLMAVATLVAAVVVERPTIVRPLMWAYSLSAAATAVLGILAFAVAGGSPEPDERAVALANQDPAFFAAILLPAFVFGFHELVFDRSRVLSAMLIVASALGIVISGTRGAWFSAIVVVAVVVLPRLEPVRRVMAVVLVVAIAAGMLQIPVIAELVGERTDSALATGGAGRTDIWSVGLRIFASAPWTGVGLANFPIANTPEQVRGVSISTGSADSLANLEPHSIVIGTLGELGLVGFALLAAFLLPLIVRPGWGPDGPMMQAALASVVFAALFLDLLGRKEAWLLIGLTCGLRYLATRGTASPSMPSPLGSARRDWTVRPRATPDSEP